MFVVICTVVGDENKFELLLKAVPAISPLFVSSTNHLVLVVLPAGYANHIQVVDVGGLVPKGTVKVELDFANTLL